MLPNNYLDYDEDEDDEVDEDSIAEESFANKTYKLNTEKKRIEGFIDDTEAKKQAIYKIINTEAETYDMYSVDFGRYLNDTIGEDRDFAIADAETNIEEAILLDNRFESVEFNEVTINHGKISLSMTVTCSDGEIIGFEGDEIDV